MNYVHALSASNAGVGSDCGTPDTREAASDTRIAYPGTFRLFLSHSQTKDEPLPKPYPKSLSHFDLTPMNATDIATSQARGATRSSLACLPCRSRHLKCDATRPQCNRCLEVARHCQYAPSRRGGLDRAALAERRGRLALAGSTAAPDSPRIQSPQTTPAVAADQEPTSRLVELPDLTDDFDVLAASIKDNGNSASVSPPTLRMHVEDIETDNLVTSYYRNFHKFHPFLLPRKSLIRRCTNAANRLDLVPLIAIMRLVGHIYAAQELSPQLKDHAEACLLQTSPKSPVLVQCRLLYSIVLFWHNYKAEANREIRATVKLAVDLKMFRQEFASENGAEDPMLMECWRRTWWMLYIVDAYYAGTLGTMNFAVVDIDVTVELPCEEWEYELGVSTAIRSDPVVSDHKADSFLANSNSKDPRRLRLSRICRRRHRILIVRILDQRPQMCGISDIYFTQNCSQGGLGGYNPVR